MRRRFAIALTTTFLLCLGLLTSPLVQAGTEGQKTRFVGAYHWHLAETWFGGVSAIDLSKDGNKMLAVTDRGYFVEAALKREAGVIVGVEVLRKSRVLRPEGHFAKRTGWRDSEGLARLSDGSLVVSFEGEHRLERFAKPGDLPVQMPWHTDFDAMPLNGGFEALAADSRDTIYAMPEVAIGPNTEIQVFQLQHGKWSAAFAFPRDKQFQPVGADFGPDNRLYVLERGFNGIGFRTRVRSFDVASGAAEDEKIILSRAIGKHDNLEGISVWRDNAGHIRVTAISDDNFRFLQRTEIVEYTLPVSP
ncbi:MAG: esterase-like activity of phytase family protein [Shimia sp.]|uniref:esterase-like activity of phytase family protein n=1 Tax=Shimia sp. TaxID=1954381 RepID=UPI004058C275